MPNHPTVRHIVAVVRQASPEGCTARYVARICGESIQAVTKALDLQVQAGTVESFEYPSEPGRKYYRMRGQS